MKAIVYEKYGSPDILQYKDIEIPKPQDDEVLIKVIAASANPMDWHMMRGQPFFIRFSMGLFKPKNTILGADIAGIIEGIGKNVTQFQIGDEVFGTSRIGAFAEYTCVNEERIVKKPEHSSFYEVAAIPVAALTALQGLRDKGQIKSGQKVLINGASGGVGTFAVQIAKSFGAEVTGVCSTRNLEMVRSIGADHVIDYTNENYTKNGQLYDLIVDAAAFNSVFKSKQSLKSQGRYVMIGGSMIQMLHIMYLGPWCSLTGQKKYGFYDGQDCKK